MLPPRLVLGLFLRPTRRLLPALALLCLASSAWAAPLTVTSSADDTTTPGTLRAEINAAQTGDTIQFDPAVTGTITLTVGELVISKSLTITGPSGGLIISANNQSRVFHVTGGAVALSGLTLTQGAAGSAAATGNGGAVLVDNGRLSLSDCTLSNSSATSANANIGGGGGLAIAPGVTATLTNCTISGNTANVGQGQAQGGGIFNRGALTITGTTAFSGNTAGIGGGLYDAGRLTLNGATFANNTAMTGGGLAGAAAGAETISNTTFSSNIAGFSGGGLSLAGRANLTACTLTSNTVGGGTGAGTASGGGLAVLSGGAVTLLTCSVTSNNSRPNGTGNSAATGGGLSVVGGSLQVTQTAVSNNNADVGGGVVVLGTASATATLTLTTSTLNNNTARGSAGDGGGGLYVGNKGGATLTNDTVSGNTVNTGSGGGVDSLAQATLSLQSCTVSGNAVNNGSGGGLFSGAVAASSTLRAALVAGNTASASPDLKGAFTSAGSNLLGIATGASGFAAASHDQIGTAAAPINPLLGPLQSNGGPTFTQALRTGSPAINGDYSANPPAADQRGVSRPVGIRADIGAFEAPSPPIAPTALTATPGFTQIRLTWTGSPNAVSYNIYRSTTPGREDLTSPINVDPNTRQTKPILGTHYTDYGLTDGVTYYYVVRAVNTAGLSDPSNEASATPRDTRVHGEVLTWGDNLSGELGNGTFTQRLLAGPIAAPTDTQGVTQPALNNVVQVAGGLRFSLALTADGTVYAWGDDTYGQLGDGNYTFSNSGDVNTSAVPTPVRSLSGVLTKIIAISAGQDHALALASDGTVYAWGRNQYGQLGNGTTDDEQNGFYYQDFYATRVRSVAQSGSLSGVIEIAAGGYHSLAVLSDGNVVAWGYNSSGQLGNGAFGPGADSAYPVAVSSLADAVAVEAGQYFSLALTADGSIYSWGYNNDGELGDGNAGTNESAPVPVQVTDPDTGSALTVTQIAAGDFHALALVSDGSVYAWGSDDTDQLGDGGSGSLGFAYQSTPAPVGTVSALEVAAGTAFSLSIQLDHTLLDWGADASGQLGTGTAAASQTPAFAQTSQGTPLPHIYGAAGGNTHALAIQNLPPTAPRLTYTVGVNITRTVRAPGLLASAVDLEGDTPLTTTLVRQAMHGTATINADGSFTYVPNANYSGADSFTYKVSDGLNDSAPATVTLNIVPETLQSIAVTPLTVTRLENVTQQFTATGTYNDANTNDLTGQVSWTSSDTTVATISNVAATAGLATTAARNAGKTTITATLGSLSATATLTVVRTLQSIAIAPKTLSLPKGTSAQFKATAIYTDGFTQDITATAIFTSANRAVAAFKDATKTPGLLTAVAVGQSIVTVTSGGKSDTATVTVTAAALTGIIVTPANAALTRGQTRAYQATGSYTDGTTVDLTQTVNWSTANLLVATVDDTGVVGAQGVGRTTITATDPASGLSGVTGVTVTDPNVVPRQHILYNLTGGEVSLWDVDTAGRITEHLYGPYAGWRATAVATGPDSRTHILWNKSDGTVSLWAVDGSGNFTNFGFGPYTDGPGKVWTATALSLGPDNVPHILWSNPDGNFSLWNVNPKTGAHTSAEYGPFPGWRATALATGPDGISRIVWNKTDGTVSLWTVDTAGTVRYVGYGPFAGWSAVSVSVGTDGTVHLLWDKTDGTISFWDVNGQDNTQQTHQEYGPFPGGWMGVACSTDPNNLSHILWGRPDQHVALWDVNSTDFTYNYRIYSPPMTSGYTPAALSSGP